MGASVFHGHIYSYLKVADQTVILFGGFRYKGNETYNFGCDLSFILAVRKGNSFQTKKKHNLLV